MLRHPHSEEVLPRVQTELPVPQFVPTAPWSPTGSVSLPSASSPPSARRPPARTWPPSAAPTVRRHHPGSQRARVGTGGARPPPRPVTFRALGKNQTEAHAHRSFGAVLEHWHPFQQPLKSRGCSEAAQAHHRSLVSTGRNATVSATTLAAQRRRNSAAADVLWKQPAPVPQRRRL